MTPILLINQSMRAPEGSSWERTREIYLAMLERFGDAHEGRPAPVNELEARVV
jgi:hypothetical protein